jgi:protein TonB
MRRRNFIVGALFSIALIAGVAWYGERTHWVPPLAPPPTRAPDPFPLPPVEPDPTAKAETDEDKPRPKVEAAAPVQPDIISAKPPADAFTQPIEPPRPVTNIREMTTIPQDRTYSDLKDQPFELSQLDNPPIVKYQARPEYPYSLRQQEITGEVLVDFIVDSNGDVRNAAAVRSDNRDFDDPACKAVSKWKFKPGRKNGHAVFTHMQVPIVFTLDKGR